MACKMRLADLPTARRSVRLRAICALGYVGDLPVACAEFLQSGKAGCHCGKDQRTGACLASCSFPAAHIGASISHPTHSREFAVRSPGSETKRNGLLQLGSQIADSMSGFRGMDELMNPANRTCIPIIIYVLLVSKLMSPAESLWRTHLVLSSHRFESPVGPRGFAKAKRLPANTEACLPHQASIRIPSREHGGCG